MFFASDNTGPVHPKVMEALIRANEGFVMGYGADPIMDEVRTRIRDVFEAPKAEVHLVGTGTAANAILLGTMAQPYDTIFCATGAHIDDSECNAPEFYTDGAKITLVPTQNGKMTPDALLGKIASFPKGVVHIARRGPVSITQITEAGTVYTVDELRALTAVARAHGLPVHLDGARFTNALVHLGCTPAEMTWRAGIDTLSFGGTKNGLMGVEAMVIFDPENTAKGMELQYRRKRGAHLFSKHRYLSAQFQAYLADDLWLEMARAANANSARLRAAFRTAGHSIHGTPEANLFFAHLPRALHARLHGAGAAYYTWGDIHAGDPAEPVKARFVTDWSLPEADLARFIALLTTA